MVQHQHRHHPARQQAARPVRKFKGVTVIEWDTEPAEERPSQFADSTLYADLWGAPRPPARRATGNGFGTLCVSLGIVLLVGTGGMLGLVHLLHA